MKMQFNTMMPFIKAVILWAIFLFIATRSHAQVKFNRMKPDTTARPVGGETDPIHLKNYPDDMVFDTIPKTLVYIRTEKTSHPECMQGYVVFKWTGAVWCYLDAKKKRLPKYYHVVYTSWPYQN